MPKNISLENTRFNEAIRVNPQGSIFLGYLYGELVVANAIDLGDGDFGDLKIGMPDLQVRITTEGKPRVDFPLKRDQNGKFVKNSRGGFVASYFSASALTREILTTLVFSLPAVRRAVENLAKRAA